MVCASPATLATLFSPALLLFAGPTSAINETWPSANTCEWPSAVQLSMWPGADHPFSDDPDDQFICSGVYVGNGVVLTAAHCIKYMADIQISFGEAVGAMHYVGTPAACEPHPDGDWIQSGSNWIYHGKDIAYCRLSASAPDLRRLPS